MATQLNFFPNVIQQFDVYSDTLKNNLESDDDKHNDIDHVKAELDNQLKPKREWLENCLRIDLDNPQSVTKDSKNEINEFSSLINYSLNKLSKLAGQSQSDELTQIQREILLEIETCSRRVTLFTTTDPLEFQQTLMWMAENGDIEDLKLLKGILEKPHFDSLDQLEFTIENISNRLQQQEQMCQIFCSEKEIGKFLPPEKIVRRYDSFVFSLLNPLQFLDVKQCYPVEYVPNHEKTKVEEGISITMRDQVIQFNLPILEEWKQQIQSFGATILRPIGRRQIVVSVDTQNSQIINQIKTIEGVEDVIDYRPSIRVKRQNLEHLGLPISKNLTAADIQMVSGSKKNVIPGILIADFFTEADREQAAKILENNSIRIADRPGKTLLVIDLNKNTNPLDLFDRIICKLIGLQSLEEKTIPKLANAQANHVVTKGTVPTSPINSSSFGLTGNGEIIAIADTGLDTGDPDTIHLDFQGRIVEIISRPFPDSFSDCLIEDAQETPDPSDRYSGHGTHVAGSALGNGKQGENAQLPHIPAGIATKAKLIFQALEKTPPLRPEWEHLPSHHIGYGIPDDLQDLFQEVYEKEARIHSNSWGGNEDESGIYNQKCQQLDQFVWEHQDFLIIMAAGNESKQNSRGEFELRTVTPPGTAKNCLTVGASESLKPNECSYTYSNLTDGEGNQRFPHDPISSDCIADSIDDIAAFSSRGPCQDNRCKPDVLAPGTFILSTRSSLVEPDETKIYPESPYYMYDSGTSMATPLVAGCAALVREYLRTEKNIDQPSAALIKAILIHSAQYFFYRFKHPSSKQWLASSTGSPALYPIG
jgi:subtilisin family serine protease